MQQIEIFEAHLGTKQDQSKAVLQKEVNAWLNKNDSRITDVQLLQSLCQNPHGVVHLVITVFYKEI